MTPAAHAPNVVPAAQTIRVVIAVSHPVQHFCPLYADLAADPRLDLTVLFGVRTGAEDYLDPDFGTVIDTGVRRELSRFRHEFLSPSTELKDELTLLRTTVWARLDELDPQVVVAYGTHQATPRWAWLWSRWRRRPVAYISDSEDRGDHPRSMRARWLARLVFAVTPVFLSVGDANREYYRDRGVRPHKLLDVPFPIDRQLYSEAWEERTQRRAAARAELGLTDEIVVMSCGKLISRKRHADLIRAVGTIEGARPVVLLVGSGEQQEDLAALAATEGVDARFLGFVSPIELPNLYLASDIYVHPSSSDPHPLAISEAIACGLPVIVSDRVGSWGPNDDVRDGGNGAVVPLGDTGALGAAIAEICSDTALRHTYAEASRAISRSRQDRAFRGFADALAGLVP